MDTRVEGRGAGKAAGIRIAAALGLVAGLIATGALAEMRIDSVIADRLTGKLYIEGQGLPSAQEGTERAYVEFGGRELKVNFDKSNSTSIEADLPSDLPDGEYQILVSRRAL